jgi:hypothetical protein
MLLGLPQAQTQTVQKPAQSGQAVPPEVVSGAPTAGPSASSEPPICDVTCVRRNADPAAQACVSLIEAKASIDYDWLSRPFGGMFAQAEQPGADGVVRYRGDSIRILVQNQWLRHSYECAWDPVARKIVGVQLRLGRLMPPASVAQLTGTPVDQQGAQVKTPAEAQQMIREALQRASLQATKVSPVVKPKPRWSESSPIAIRQARLHVRQVDSLINIDQASRRRSAQSEQDRARAQLRQAE